MSFRTFLRLPGSTFIQIVLQNLWAAVFVAWSGSLAFYWQWFVAQNFLMKGVIVICPIIAIFFFYVMVRVAILNTAERRKARTEVVEAQRLIKNWAEPILSGLRLDLNHSRPVADYGDDPTSIISAKNRIVQNDAQWKLGLNRLIAEMAKGYEAYQEHRARMQANTEPDAETIKRIRKEMHAAMVQIIHACNGIMRLVR